MGIKIKVLMLVGRYRFGGITTVIENLSENLMKKGIDVTIGALRFEHEPIKTELKTEKISFNPLKAKKQLNIAQLMSLH